MLLYREEDIKRRSAFSPYDYYGQILLQEQPPSKLFLGHHFVYPICSISWCKLEDFIELMHIYYMTYMATPYHNIFFSGHLFFVICSNVSER